MSVKSALNELTRESKNTAAVHHARTFSLRDRQQLCAGEQAQTFEVIYPQNRHVTITKLQLKFALPAAGGGTERGDEGWRLLLNTGAIC